jgi:hypothetical protein
MAKTSFYSGTGISVTEVESIEAIKDAAEASKDAAASSASAAAASATAAASSETDAQTAQTAAETAKTAAESARDAASTSATSASTSASTATTQASTATTKASEAATSATNAATSETNASTSASNAASSATSAASSASTATTKASEASTSASNASTSETNAASSASSASTSASTATTKASEASTSASNASTSETNAASSATSASSSASTATTKASEASTSASNAASSASSAASSASSAAASFDAFDDIYLGAFTSNPTTDNDGDALATGALYFKSDSNVLRVYNGSSWQDAAVDASGFLTASGGTLTGDLNGTNVTLSGYLRGPSSFTIDPAAHGDNTGTLIVAGNLQVDGTTTTINSTTLDVDDLNITVASGAANAAAANGAGLTVDGASATFTYASTGDKWTMNKPLDVTGNIIVSGTVDGRDVATDGTKLDTVATSATANPNAIDNVVEDTTPQLGGDLASNGNDILFADNDKAIFGSGSDLQIYSDGTTGQITGDVNITGTLTSDGLTVDNSGSNNFLRLNNSTTGRFAVYNLDDNQDLILWNGDSLATGSNGIRLKTGSGSGINRALFAANGDISFYEDTGTTAKFFWDASAESLGIGTSSPSAKLNVIGSGRFDNSAATPVRLHINNSGSNDYASIYADTTSAYKNLVLNPNGGNVGIGTSSPSSYWANADDLVVSTSGNTGISVVSGTTSLGYLIFADSTAGGDNTRGGLGYDHSTNNMLFRVNNDTKMTIDSNGQIGVSGSTASFDTTGAVNGLQLYYETDAGVATVGSYSGGGSSALTFHTNSGAGASSEAMRIDSSGNVGIGTTSLTGKAHIYKSSVNSAIIGTSYNGHYFESQSDDATDGFEIYQKHGSNTTRNSFIVNDNRTGSKSAAFVVRGDGNVGIGTNSPATPLDVTTAGGGNFVATFQNTTSATPYGVHIKDAASGANGYPLLQVTNSAGSETHFRVDSGTGNVFVGVPSSITAGSEGIELRGDLGYIKTGRNNTGSVGHFLFYNPNGNVGSITTSGSSTAFNTSSDHRLKENVTDVTDGITRVKQLEPKRFNFIVDPDTTVDGFLAHEVQEFVPEAVTGAKDAMRDEEYEVTPAVTDDDGNVVTEAVMGTRSVPDYQGIDQSKLVPLLTAALKEAITKIETLETEMTSVKARLDALEGT